MYRGLDIGTAKVTLAERARVRHHGLDLVEPDEPFSVADFAAHAGAALAGIAARGALALLVGGTGLYLRAVGRGVPFGTRPSDPALRARLEAQLAAEGVAALAARLAELAPATAARTDPRNPRRVVRALEVALLAGDVPLPVPAGYAAPSRWLGLQPDPALQRTWIEARARGQFAAGLLDEAAALRARYPEDLPAFSAIGYPEAFAVLDGRLDLEAAIEQDIARNVAFARRQRTWFRAEPGIAWLDPTAPDAAALTAARALLAGEGSDRP